jgi:hypothetical protein
MDAAIKKPGAQPTEGNRSGAERRVHERHEAQSYLRAIDAASGDLLGELEDISLGGFKLEVHQVIRRGATYDLRIDIRIDGRNPLPIEVKARNIWVHRLEFDGKARAGFVFIGLVPAARARLEALFAEIGGMA